MLPDLPTRKRKRKPWRYIHNGEGREHVLVAVRVWGKSLPSGAVVHHIDGNPRNNEPSNLVICENMAYHTLLHYRQTAYRATGNPNARHCHRCKRWDVPENLRRDGNGSVHNACEAAYRRARYIPVER